jgi:hypothetical protein
MSAKQTPRTKLSPAGAVMGRSQISRSANRQGAIPDPDHDLSHPKANHEARMQAEINELREKLRISEESRQQIWQANIGLQQQLNGDHAQLEQEAAHAGRLAKSLRRALTAINAGFGKPQRDHIIAEGEALLADYRATQAPQE